MKLSARHQQWFKEALMADGVTPPVLLPPPSLVSISDGTQITEDDIANFDSRWMQPDDRANNLGSADFLLKNRIDAGAWEIGERMRRRPSA